MAITNSSILTEITRVADPLTSNSGALAFATGDTIFANGYRLDVFGVFTSNSQTYYGQLYDVNDNAVGENLSFGSGQYISDMRIVDLGNGLFAQSATREPSMSAVDSIVLSVFNSVTAERISSILIRDAGTSLDPVDYFALASGGFAFSYKASLDTGSGGIGPFLPHWGFIDADGKIVTKDIPGSLITDVVE